MGTTTDTTIDRSGSVTTTDPAPHQPAPTWHDPSPAAPSTTTAPPPTRRTAAALLRQFGRALFSAASMPGHPYLPPSLGPNGTVLWVENHRLSSRTMSQDRI